MIRMILPTRTVPLEPQSKTTPCTCNFRSWYCTTKKIFSIFYFSSWVAHGKMQDGYEYLCPRGGRERRYMIQMMRLVPLEPQ